MTEFTDGPWKIPKQQDGVDIEIWAGDESMIVADVRLFSDDVENQAANSRLIAAAPDLLAALEEFANQFGALYKTHSLPLGLHAAYATTLRAITKAGGSITEEADLHLQHLDADAKAHGE